MGFQLKSPSPGVFQSQFPTPMGPWGLVWGTLPQFKMHQCKRLKFWCRWLVSAGQDSLAGKIFALVGRARTYLISNSLYVLEVQPSS